MSERIKEIRLKAIRTAIHGISCLEFSDIEFLLDRVERLERAINVAVELRERIKLLGDVHKYDHKLEEALKDLDEGSK